MPRYTDLARAAAETGRSFSCPPSATPHPLDDLAHWERAFRPPPPPVASLRQLGLDPRDVGRAAAPPFPRSYNSADVAAITSQQGRRPLLDTIVADHHEID